jgi:hypothetical protein
LELMVNRIAGRAGLKEETVWLRLNDLRDRAREGPGKPGQASTAPEQPQEARHGSAPIHEVELLEVLLAEPALVAKAQAALDPDRIEHPGVRRLLEGMYQLSREGLTPDLDHLRPRIDNPALLAKARQWLDKGTANPDRQATLQDVLTRFRQRLASSQKRELQNQVHSATDHAQAVELLRKHQSI